MRCIVVSLLLLLSSAGPAQSIPTTEAKALDGAKFALPHDLTAPSILLIGFSRKSAIQTKIWQQQLHAALPPKSPIRVFDVAMLGAVPELMRGFVTRAIRRDVPDPFEHDFLIITSPETDWKLATHFDPKSFDAAYVLLLNPRGDILWQTHDAFNPTALAQLTTRAAAIH